MKKNLYLSFCIPVFNEEKIIKSNILKIKYELDNIIGKNGYEIVVVENGSTDNTLKELKAIKLNNLRYMVLGNKAHGSAMKTSIVNARGKYVLLSAIDLPFGFSDLREMIKLENNFPIILGSKFHPKSIIFISISRKVSSYLYHFLLRLLFNLNIKDTQGTIFLERDKILPVLKYCDSRNAFFSAQLVIFSQNFELKTVEVPVVMEKKSLRKSKYKIIRDGSKMFYSMLRTFLNYRISSHLSQSLK